MSQWLRPPLKVLGLILVVLFNINVQIFSYKHNPHHDFYFKHPQNNFIFTDYHHHQGYSHYGNQAPPPPKVPPQQVMIDLVNDLGLKLLAIHNENNENNIAISPYGALSVLVALAEGVLGDATDEIHQCAHVPYNIPLVRVGLRDIHRHLKSYFIPEEGFLGGLTFNNDNVTLKPEYEEILRFYGFDVESFNNALMPDALFAENANKTVINITSTTMVPDMRDEAGSTTTESTTKSTKEMDSNTAETTLVTAEITTLISTVVPSSTTVKESVTNQPETTTTTEFAKNNFSESTTLSTNKKPASSTESSTTENISTTTQSKTTTILSITQTEITTIPTTISTTEMSTTSEKSTTTERSIMKISTTTEKNTESTESVTLKQMTTTNLPLNRNSTTTLVPLPTTTSGTSNTTFTAITNENSIPTTEYFTPTVIPSQDAIPSFTDSTTINPPESTISESTTTLLYENITFPIFNLATPENSFFTGTESSTIFNTESTTNLEAAESSTIANFDYTNEETTFFEDFSVFSTEAPSTAFYDELSTTTNVPDYSDNFVFNSVNEISTGTTANNNFQRRKRDLSRNYISFNSKKDIETEKVENSTLKRKARSLVDYLIARYYDDHAEQQNYNSYHPESPYISEEQPSFLIYGKYREYKVDFMKYDTVLPFYYVPHLDALALSFPLDSTRYYLLLLLPIDEHGIDNLVCNLRLHINLKFIIENLRYHHVRALIPSFMLKGFVNLTPTLQKLGIRKVFEPRQADFSPMTNEKDIYVKNIEQAITVTIRNYMDPMTMEPFRNLHQMHPVLFKADHPFLYFVIDSDLHVTLMAGKIVNPLNSRIL